jgi:probable H4MPT-linked C1 transfer pathway protein
MTKIIGWDIGGAHLKAARVENGKIVQAVQVACPLWLGVGELDRAFAVAKGMIGTAPLNAVTMTGELCDAFESRNDGVCGLVEIAARVLAPNGILVYAGRLGFVEPSRVRAHAPHIASANWHASASIAATFAKNALFIDMGSTTTDIVPIVAGHPANLGTTDAERLGHGELVYTGLGRTFLMAGPDRVPFAGRWTPLMNEWFADAADIHRILGALPEKADMMETADGRDKTKPASRARLARMIGRDASEADDAAWDRLAGYFAEVQLRTIMDSAMLVLSRGLFGKEAPIIGAGVGRDVIGRIAGRLGRPFHLFEDVIAAEPEARAAADDCAPASAIALLLRAQRGA